MKVSIITPTTESRKHFMPRLEEIINSQTYQDIEWLVDSGIGTIGAKRNRLCEIATGEIIVHFDDDDFYSPTYIEIAVNHLINSVANTTDLNCAMFANIDKKLAWQYTYKGSQPYVLGSGMMYYKKVWERNKFKDISEGEDMHFVANAGRVIACNLFNHFYASIHGDNTCSHKSIKVFNLLDFAIFEKNTNYANRKS